MLALAAKLMDGAGHDVGTLAYAHHCHRQFDA